MFCKDRELTYTSYGNLVFSSFCQFDNWWRLEGALRAINLRSNIHECCLLSMLPLLVRSWRNCWFKKISGWPETLCNCWYSCLVIYFASSSSALCIPQGKVQQQYRIFWFGKRCSRVFVQSASSTPHWGPRKRGSSSKRDIPWPKTCCHAATALIRRDDMKAPPMWNCQ